MKVSRLPKDPGISGWYAVLPEPEPAHPLTQNVSADWLVIGAGFAGLAAARNLAKHRPEDKIVILDAARVAEGPAGRNSGFVVDLPHDLASEDYGGTLQADLDQTDDNRRAIALMGEMAAEYDLPEEAFSMAGKLNGAATAKGLAHLKTYSDHLSEMNEPHDMLDAAEMKEVTGTDFYTGGLRTPGTAILQPAMFTRGIAKGLQSNRVSLHENSPVTELIRNGDWVAKTPNGQVSAPKVILAVNGHLNSFGFYENQLMHVFTYASMSEPMTEDQVARLGGHNRWGITPADPLGSSIRRISGAGGDRLLVRNRFTFDPDMEVSDARIARVGQDHDRSFAARFPMLPDLKMQFRWGGRLCISRNTVQVIRELEPGLFSACVQNGIGTSKGTLAGILATELAMGLTSPALERARAYPAPQKLPPRPFSTLGANAYLRWGEFKAGREL